MAPNPTVVLPGGREALPTVGCLIHSASVRGIRSIEGSGEEIRLWSGCGIAGQHSRSGFSLIHREGVLAPDHHCTVAPASGFCGRSPKT